MFSVEQKRMIADKIQKIIRETNHPELPEGEISLKWKPKEGEKYFLINFLPYYGLLIEKYLCQNDLIDESLFKMGNYFKTEKEAQTKLKQILELLKK